VTDGFHGVSPFVVVTIALRKCGGKRQDFKRVLQICKGVVVDWDDLRVFLAVVRAESLSGAGKVLRLDPATVGRRIARLEQAMSVRLFVKSPQGYGLTEAASRLMSHAEAVETTLAAACLILNAALGVLGSHCPPLHLWRAVAAVGSQAAGS